MLAWEAQDGLRWRALPKFGVEIDADFAAPLPDAARARFVDLFAQYGLIVAHNQNLSMEQQVAFATMVGPLLIRPTEDGLISTDKGNRVELSFHADNAYTPNPFDALSLHALDVVDGASSTRFASAERAYADLPDALRDTLTTHDVDMISPALDILNKRVAGVREPNATRRGVRPALLQNPRTGKTCVGISEMHAARLLGLDWEDSRDALYAAYDILYAPENVTEHVWNSGDLILWDNITFQHARGSLDGVGRRVLQRVLIGVGDVGGAPAPDAMM